MLIIDDLSVCFSPEMDCAAFITDKIGRATATLTVAAYNFTERRIVAAIVAAHQRGVAVTVKLDKISPCQKGAGAAALLDAGVPTFIDGKVKIAHDKVIIIDSAAVIFGSFNFSAAAGKNAEDTVFLERPDAAQAFEAHIQRRLAASVPYTKREAFCRTG